MDILVCRRGGGREEGGGVAPIIQKNLSLFIEIEVHRASPTFSLLNPEKAAENGDKLFTQRHCTFPNATEVQYSCTIRSRRVGVEHTSPDI